MNLKNLLSCILISTAVTGCGRNCMESEKSNLENRPNLVFAIPLSEEESKQRFLLNRAPEYSLDLESSLPILSFNSEGNIMNITVARRIYGSSEAPIIFFETEWHKIIGFYGTDLSRETLDICLTSDHFEKGKRYEVEVSAQNREGYKDSITALVTIK